MHRRRRITQTRRTNEGSLEAAKSAQSQTRAKEEERSASGKVTAAQDAADPYSRQVVRAHRVVLSMGGPIRGRPFICDPGRPGVIREMLTIGSREIDKGRGGRLPMYVPLELTTSDSGESFWPTSQ